MDLQGVVSKEGWKPEAKGWGRKVRVGVSDGYDGQRLADLVRARWPDVRMQLRND
jgi:hypothetical protein